MPTKRTVKSRKTNKFKKGSGGFSVKSVSTSRKELLQKKEQNRNIEQYIKILIIKAKQALLLKKEQNKSFIQVKKLLEKLRKKINKSLES